MPNPTHRRLIALARLTPIAVPKSGDKVRLRVPFADLSRGTVGVVVGHYTNNGDLAVTFNGNLTRIPALDVGGVPSLHAA